MNEDLKVYEGYVIEHIDNLIKYNENLNQEKDISTSGKISCGLFSGISKISEYIHSLAKNNNLHGTLLKDGCTLRYSYNGKQSDIDNFNVGIKSI